MKLNSKLFFQHWYYSFFKARNTPGKLTPKRVLVLSFIFLIYPLWHLSIRIAYLLDNLFFPEYQQQKVAQPIFIVGNFRSGTTFLHRLLIKDEASTGLRSWEIYLAPSIVQRKFLRWSMRINYAIGNPVQKIITAFERALSNYSYMHKTGLNEVEEDSHIFFHIWSTYNLLALFPFPQLVRKYMYYDDQVSEEQKAQDMAYYQEVLKRHVFVHAGKRYVAKNPTYSPKVRALHREFPDARFIHIVRSPLRVIPSSISMFSNHWRTYGEPENEYPPPIQDTVIEHAKHWYLYPHRYLKTLPPEQYCLVHYRDLVDDPQGTIERIYAQFGLDISPAYAEILYQESERSKSFRSKHQYSLQEMGLSAQKLRREFQTVEKQYDSI